MTEAELETLALLLKKATLVVDTGENEGVLIEFDQVTRARDGRQILLFQFELEPKEDDDPLPPRHLRSVN